MTNLKNVNVMPRSTFDAQETINDDELYFVESSEVITFPDYSASVSISIHTVPDLGMSATAASTLHS